MGLENDGQETKALCSVPGPCDMSMTTLKAYEAQQNKLTKLINLVAKRKGKKVENFVNAKDIELANLYYN